MSTLGQMTKFCKHADELVSAIWDPSADDPNPEFITEFEGIVKSMKQKLKFMEALDSQIIDLTDEETLENIIVESDDYVQEMNAVIHKYSTVFVPAQTASTNNQTTEPNDQSGSHSTKKMQGKSTETTASNI